MGAFSSWWSFFVRALSVFSWHRADALRVFICDAEGKPKGRVFLVGPASAHCYPDARGIASLPSSWRGKTVSVRDLSFQELVTFRVPKRSDGPHRIILP